MVSEKEILEAFDLYLSEENLELYDLNIVDYPSISRVEVYIVSDNEIDIDLTSVSYTHLTLPTNSLV